ncbi:MAG: DoxX family protein [Flavobacteriaceae bacterium]|nr:DoxX family protein [Flavobacteriaceae bacterium]
MNKNLLFVLRLFVAVILLQTLYYKFGAHEDSVYIFTTLGLEPYERIGIGVMELIASILILIKKTSWAGALLTVGLMAGAIFSHLTQLGIEVKGDGGQLFYMAIGTWVLSLIVLWSERKQIPFIN